MSQKGSVNVVLVVLVAVLADTEAYIVRALLWAGFAG